MNTPCGKREAESAPGKRVEPAPEHLHRRVLSLFLALCLVGSLLIGNVSFAVGGSNDSAAASDDTAVQDDATDAAAIDGTDGTSDPADEAAPEADTAPADDSEDGSETRASGNSVATQAVNFDNGTVVNCYVSDGDAWVKIDQYREDHTVTLSNGKSRVATYAEDLEKIFGIYGFKAEDYKGEMWFPQTDKTKDGNDWIENPTNYLWPDATAERDRLGHYQILLTTDGRRIVDLFYTNQVDANVPKYKETSGKVSGSILRTNSQFLTDCKMAQILYKIRIQDPTNLFEGAENSPVTDDPITVERGATKAVTLPAVIGTTPLIWTIYNQDGDEVTVPMTSDEANNTVTYTLENVQSSYRFVPSTAADALKVRCYLSVDGTWTQVGTLLTNSTMGQEDKDRFYLTAEQFEPVYGKYGFQASDVAAVNNAQNNILPHNTDDENVIWFDAIPQQQTDGKWRVMLVSYANRGKTANVYYTPGAAQVAISGGSASMADAMTGSKFYTVSTKDPGRAFGAAQLPEQLVVREGASASITVPMQEGTDWTVYSDGAELSAEDYEVTPSADGATATYTFNAVTRKIQLVAAGTSIEVRYTTTLDGHFENMANEVTVDTQVVLENRDGMINGKVRTEDDPLKVLVDKNGSCTLPHLDSDTAWSLHKSGNSAQTEKEKKYIYTFMGWQVGDDPNRILPADATLTYAQLIDYMDSDGVVHLSPRWEGRTASKLSTSINFYVRMNCEIIDNKQNGVLPDASTASEFYTKSVFTTRLFGIDNLVGDAVKKVNRIFLMGDRADTAYDIDKQIRESVTKPVAYDGGDTLGTANFQLESLPSDETVLSEIRQQVTAKKATITIDGATIPAEQITSDNFTVRWYVLKHEVTDGWHIDGVLVAKAARLVVTKTFAGDDDAINQIRGDASFEIAVTHAEDGQTVNDYTLTLNSFNAEGRDGKTGYDYYDDKTKTYTWVLEGRQGRTYTVKEENYTLDETRSVDEDGNQVTTWNSSHSYQIHDSPGGTADTNGWRPYDPTQGVQVTVTSYANDVPNTSYQTVAFLNTYVQSGLLTVQKVDANSGNGLSDVKFRISHASGEAVTLYYNEAKNLYSTSESKKSMAGWAALNDPVVTTDQNGMFFIELAIRSESQTVENYLLEETVPGGYEGPTKIEVAVDGSGKVTAASTVTAATTATPPEGGWISGQDTFTLTVKNQSKPLLELTAVKQWADATADSYKKPVRVRLVRDGALLTGDEYTQELNADNNWTYSWKNLPLFVDGHPAQYTLREIAIGDTAYDPSTDSTDGYADYQVSYDQTQYWEGDDASQAGANSYWTEKDGTVHYADHARLTVHNTVRSSAFSFTKVNEDGKTLSGAVFKAWNADKLDNDPFNLLDTDVEPDATVSSDANGVVTFPELPAGTYYVQETEPPEGYDLFSVYTKYLKVVITNGRADISLWDLMSWDEEELPFDDNFVNIANMQLTILKLDRDDKTTLLSGAVFRVIKNNAPYGDGEYATGDKGIAGPITQMTDGDYQIEEITPPDGYRLPQDSIIVRVTNGRMTIVGEHEADHCELVRDPDSPNLYTLKVYDPPIYNLPTAGGIGIYPMLAVGTAAMCTAAGGMIVIRRSRKTEKRQRR